MAAGDIILSSGTVITAAEIQQIAAEVKKELAAESKELADFEETGSLNNVSSLPGIQQSGSSMKLVRVAISALKGLDGKQIELAASQTAIQWRYVGATSWNILVDLSMLKGDKGDSPELRKGPTGIEWKYDNESEWKTLVAVSDLAFKFADLTDEQIGELWDNLPGNILSEFQKPATEAAKTANAAANAANEKASLANSAASAASSAALQANQAASSANAAAQSANQAADEAIEGANGLQAGLERLEELEGNLTAQARQQPTSMALSYPKKITKGVYAGHRIAATLSPAGTGSNVLFLGDDKAVSVAPDGFISVNGLGKSRVYVIPTENTSIYQTIEIEVIAASLRLNTKTQLRLLSNGNLRFN